MRWSSPAPLVSLCAPVTDPLGRPAGEYLKPWARLRGAIPKPGYTISLCRIHGKELVLPVAEVFRPGVTGTSLILKLEPRVNTQDLHDQLVAVGWRYRELYWPSVTPVSD